jgi:hypothetical protein
MLGREEEGRRRVEELDREVEGERRRNIGQLEELKKMKEIEKMTELKMVELQQKLQEQEAILETNKEAILSLKVKLT